MENAMSKKYVKSMVAIKPVTKDIQKHVEFLMLMDTALLVITVCISTKLTIERNIQI